MTRRELKALLGVTVGCIAMMVAVAFGLKLLGAGSDGISLGLVVTTALSAFAAAFAFDHYSTPPDRR